MPSDLLGTDLNERLGFIRNPVKRAAGWVTGKVTNIKTNERITGSADLSVLLESEALSLGIEGKRVMWLVLREAAAVEPALAGTDFDKLIARAEQQRATLEPYRVEAGRTAFTSA